MYEMKNELYVRYRRGLFPCRSGTRRRSPAPPGSSPGCRSGRSGTPDNIEIKYCGYLSPTG